MKLSIIPSLLLATLAGACVQEGRACAAGGDKCCLRRSCVSSTKGSSLGFCVSIDAGSLLNQPMATAVPAAPAPAPAAPATGGQPNNNGGMMGEPNGNNGNGQAPSMGGSMNGAQPNPNNGQPANMNGPGMFPVSGGQRPNGVNQANTGNADYPFYIVPVST